MDATSTRSVCSQTGSPDFASRCRLAASFSVKSGGPDFDTSKARTALALLLVRVDNANKFLAGAEKRKRSGELDDTAFLVETRPARLLILSHRVLDELLAAATKNRDLWAVSCVTAAAQSMRNCFGDSILFKHTAYGDSRDPMMAERHGVAESVYCVLVRAIGDLQGTYPEVHIPKFEAIL
ncbi:MAG: hypothetical protein ABII39_00765 [Candidatus Micrarchaeota archaeon]